MKKEIKSHYDDLSSIYDQLWTYSDDFVNEISKQITLKLELKNDDILVDYGCGTGIYSKAIAKQMQLKHDIICTDLSEKMFSKLKGKAGFRVIAKDAVGFSELKMKYDKVFIKEMIHHIKEGRQRIYTNIFVPTPTMLGPRKQLIKKEQDGDDT